MFNNFYLPYDKHAAKEPSYSFQTFLLITSFEEDVLTLLHFETMNNLPFCERKNKLPIFCTKLLHSFQSSTSVSVQKSCI